MSAADIVRAWFAAFDRNDMAAAEALFAPEGTLHGDDGDHIGMAGFLDFYAAKRSREGAGFAWRLVDVSGAGDLGVALVALSNHGHAWTQAAVYRVAGDRIAEIWIHEGARG